MSARNQAARRRTVSIVYTTMPQYRVPFFEGLGAYLDARDIDLRVHYGQPPSEFAKRGDVKALPSGEVFTSRRLHIGSVEFLYQPILRRVRHDDLVIVEQHLKQLSNYFLYAWDRVGGPPVAMWGHGSLHAAQTPTHARAKGWISRLPRWWFAYTEDTAEAVARLGFDRSRVTVVQNAVDTTALRHASRATEEDVRSGRTKLGLGAGPVGLALGAVDARKRPEVLLEVAELIRRTIPDFELMVVGAGVDKHVIERAAAEHDWLHYLGSKFGEDKARIAELADLIIHPGKVGLIAVDSFAAGLPMVTIRDDAPPPEYAYLVDGVNAAFAQNSSAQAIADRAIEVIRNREFYATLRAGCDEAASRYTLEAMVENFGLGVTHALEAIGSK